MISPPPVSSSAGGSRRARYSRSPSPNVSSSKRSKPSHSHSNETYDRNQDNGSDQNRLYTSICVKNINPKLSDSDIRELCDKKFSKYGSNTVKIYHRNQERVAFVNFNSSEEAKKARHAKSGLVWENMRVSLEPVYYRRTIPAEQSLNSHSSRERSSPSRRHRRSPSRSPSPPLPPPPSSSKGRYSSSSSRHQRAISPLRSSRPPRRPYSPYIPIPPDLLDYATTGSNRRRQHSSPSPSPPPRRRHRQSRSGSSSRSRANDSEVNGQNDPTRILIVENLQRDTSESKLKELFGRYGSIDEISLKKSNSSSRRLYASIRYENVDMAYKARQTMDGQIIGKSECKIRYGETLPTRYLWVGNIPIGMKRRDLEHAFARHGQIKSLDYGNGDPTAIVTYNDVEDAIKARTRLIGAIQISAGQTIPNDSNLSPSSRRGFRIDYLDRPTTRRFVIVRPQSRVSSPRASPSRTENSYEASPRNDRSPAMSDQSEEENLKTEARSPSPATLISNPIKQRRSTERSESPVTNNVLPIAGRTFYSPIGSYLSPNDTSSIRNVPQLMTLCEQLNSAATRDSTALSTVYPVEFILKSHAYEARMHFLAGNPTLASILLGQPGDLVAAKTELRITQRLRLNQHKLDDLERTLFLNVSNAIAMTGHYSQPELNGHIPNGVLISNGRKQITAPSQTKFVILIASPKLNRTDSNLANTSKESVKNEAATPPHSAFSSDNDRCLKLKEEKLDVHPENTDEDDEYSLSKLISYLLAKEAAGVISIPFYPTPFYDFNHSSKQETALLHIFPPCDFSEKILKFICPSIHFSSSNIDEHLMLIIVQSE